MTDRWEQAEQIYRAARDYPPEDRPAFLDRASDGDAELRTAVESLLAQYSGPDLPAGTRIRHYEIESLLGRGGAGVVYRGRDCKLNLSVALKFLYRGMEDAAARHRFQREAQMASALHHPHIVTVHDVDEYQGRQYRSESTRLNSSH